MSETLARLLNVIVTLAILALIVGGPILMLALYNRWKKRGQERKPVAALPDAKARSEAPSRAAAASRPEAVARPATVAESTLELFNSGFNCYDLEDLRRPGPEMKPRPMSRLLAGILVAAVDKGAWSVHIEPFPGTVRVRFRCGRTWQPLAEYPESEYKPLLADLAATFGLDPNPMNPVPGDGLTLLKIPGGAWYEVYAGTVRGVNGQIVRIGFRMRESSFDLDLDKLGFAPPDLDRFKRAVDAPTGLVVVAGPTHAGKSIVCYSALMRRLLRGDAVATVERPRKFLLKGGLQVPITSRESYCHGLQKALRIDPRLVMLQEVCEYPDYLAAAHESRRRLVIYGVHVGHAVDVVCNLFIVLMSNSTGSAAGSVGAPAPSVLIAGALTLACAARQVRLICPDCREEFKMPAAAIAKAGLNIDPRGQVKVYRGRGCGQCWGRGFRGQTGVYEVLAVSPAIKELIAAETMSEPVGGDEQAFEAYRQHWDEWRRALARQARAEGVASMREAALQKALAGLTTVQEAIQQTPPPYDRQAG